MPSTETTGRGFWQFFGRGLFVTSITIAAYVILIVVWADFLHQNPGRTTRDSWVMIAWSPIIGFGLCLMTSLLPIMVAALGAKMICQIAGRFPSFAIALLLFPCVLAGLLQGDLIMPPDAGDHPDIKRAAIHMAGFSLPMLITFWLSARRSRKRQLRTESDVAWGKDDPV